MSTNGNENMSVVDQIVHAAKELFIGEVGPFANEVIHESGPLPGGAGQLRDLANGIWSRSRIPVAAAEDLARAIGLEPSHLASIADIQKMMDRFESEVISPLKAIAQIHKEVFDDPTVNRDYLNQIKNMAVTSLKIIGKDNRVAESE